MSSAAPANSAKCNSNPSGQGVLLRALFPENLVPPRRPELKLAQTGRVLPWDFPNGGLIPRGSSKLNFMAFFLGVNTMNSEALCTDDMTGFRASWTGSLPLSPRGFGMADESSKRRCMFSGLGGWHCSLCPPNLTLAFKPLQ